MEYFSNLGFYFNTGEELAHFLTEILKKDGRMHLPVPGDWSAGKRYVWWEVKKDPIYFYAVQFGEDPEKSELSAPLPAFKGSIRKKFRVDNILEPAPYEYILEGALEAQEPIHTDNIKSADSPGDVINFAEMSKATQVHFQAPNYLMKDPHPKVGEYIDVNITVFPHAINISTPENTQMKGLFLSPKLLKEDPIKAKQIPDDIYGIIGEIKDFKTIKNPYTKKEFLYMVIWQEILGSFELVTSMPPEEVFKEKVRRGNFVWAEGKVVGLL